MCVNPREQQLLNHINGLFGNKNRSVLKVTLLIFLPNPRDSTLMGQWILKVSFRQLRLSVFVEIIF